MTDDSRVQQLLDELDDLHTTPEEVCRSYPELLPAVRDQWQRMRRLRADLSALFPPSESTPRQRPDWTVLPEIPGHEVEAAIGRGGMGIVFRARHVRLNRPVAVKMLLAGAYAEPHERGRFQREAEAVARLRHPNVVQVHETGEADGRPYFTMELVDGGSLAQEVAGTPQSVLPAAELVATLAQAIQAAHTCGIIHRDLKPGNVLLTPDGTPKISDFGLARRLGGESELTRTGNALGTPSYMAPEQVEGKSGSVGTATDVYALGAILYELLTGRPPFKGESAEETLRQVVSQEPVSPTRLNAKVPRDLETICLKCLHKTASRRYSSAHELAADLHRYLDGAPIRARRVGTSERALKWARRRPAAALLIAALLVVLVAAVGTGFWFRQQETDRRADKEQREAKARDAILTALRRADDFRREERWQEALEILEGATAHVTEANSPPLEQSLHNAQSDFHIAKDLEIARESYPLSPEGTLDDRQRASEFLRMFVEAGFSLDDDAKAVAARISNSAIRDQLVAALDDRAVVAFRLDDMPLVKRFLMIAKLADRESPWRERFRDSSIWGKSNQLQELAATAFISSPPPTEHQLALLALLLNSSGANEQSVDLLGEACRRQPRNFWVHREMGFMLARIARYREATGYFRAALSLRPENSAAHEGLGHCFARLGQSDDAISEFRRAVECAPDRGPTRDKLVWALAEGGYWFDAEAECRSALEADRTNYLPLLSLAEVLERNGRLEKALVPARKAAEIAPNSAKTQNALSAICVKLARHEEAILAYRRLIELKSPIFSLVDHLLARELVAAGRLEEAITVLQAAIARKPDHPQFHLEMGTIYQAHGKAEAAVEAFRKVTTFKDKSHWIWEGMAAIRLNQGRFGEARTALEQFDEARTALEKVQKLPKGDEERRGRRRQLDLCHSLVAIENKLPAILAGMERPADASIQRALAEWCLTHKRLTATAADYYTSALATQPSLADDLEAGNRYHAACAAALAGCGIGEDVGKLDGDRRAALRRSARDWLTAEYDACAARHRVGKPGDRTIVATALRSWLKSDNLACIRDEQALAKLPTEDQRAWQALWENVAALAARDPAAKFEQARALVARREWKEAAKSYLEAMELEPTEDAELWFEYAASQLLAGDSVGYHRAREHMLARCQPKGPMRPYLVARAWTLAPVSEGQMMQLLPAGLEVNQKQTEFWAATEQGAMMFREDKPRLAVRSLETSLVADGRPGQAVLNWLWLALVHHKMGSPTEARRWLAKATNWLDQQGSQMPLDENAMGAHRLNWLEAHVLREELRSLLP